MQIDDLERQLLTNHQWQLELAARMLDYSTRQSLTERAGFDLPRCGTGKRIFRSRRDSSSTTPVVKAGMAVPLK